MEVVPTAMWASEKYEEFDNEAETYSQPCCNAPKYNSLGGEYWRILENGSKGSTNNSLNSEEWERVTMKQVVLHCNWLLNKILRQTLEQSSSKPNDLRIGRYTDKQSRVKTSDPSCNCTVDKVPDN